MWTPDGQKNCHPSDLFVTYFTSSKYVAAHIKEYGLPDIVEVTQTFTGSPDGEVEGSTGISN